MQIDERHHLDARFDALRNELIAGFRHELAAAVAIPTRTIVAAITIGAIILSAYTLTLAQVLA